MAQYIPWLISAASLLIAYLSFMRNGSKDSAEEKEKNSAKIDGIKESLIEVTMKLDQVFATTTETRADIKSLNQDMSALDRRLTIVERDVKTAFTRIDEIRDDGK